MIVKTDHNLSKPCRLLGTHRDGIREGEGPIYLWACLPPGEQLAIDANLLAVILPA